MAKNSKSTKASKAAKSQRVVTLTPEQQAAVGASLVSAYTSSATAGRSAVVAMAASLHKTLRGETNIDPDSITNITALVGRARGWKGRTLVSRKSELVALIRSYASLDKASCLLVKQTGCCNFHNVVSMARAIAKGAKAVEAVKAVTSKGKGAGKIKTPEQAEKRLAIIIRKALEMPHLSRNIRALLQGVAGAVA